MKRTYKLKRTGFARKPPMWPLRGTQYHGAGPTPRTPALRVSDGKARMVVPLPKESPLQHLGYMNTVRSLACYRCGYSAKRSQFCHADEGKGERIKTDCRLGWPGCGPHDDEPGCHWYVGTSGRMPKEVRRQFERDAGKQTRLDVLAAGLWPSRLPQWVES